jgi:hypothetical protein
VWYAEAKLIITVQGNYQQEYGGDVPDMKSIKAWFDKFFAVGGVLKQSGGTHWSVLECIGVFPKRKLKKVALHSREAPINLSSIEGTICTTYDNAPSTPQAASFVCI